MPRAQGARRRPGDLYALCALWRGALNSLEAALGAAGRTLTAQELARRRERLTADRAAILRLINGIAQDRGVHPRFLHLRSREGTKALLGLRPDVTACVFDLDGVLVASDALHVAAWRTTFDEVTWRTERTIGRFTPFNPRTDYQLHFHGKPRLDGVRGFLASRGISLPEGDPHDPPDAATVHGLANRKNEALLRLIDEHGVAAYAGSLLYLDFALEAGVRTAVVSASANTQALLERAGLAGRIESCIDGNTIAVERMRVKPAPDTLMAACRGLGLEPQQAAAFETSRAGVMSARAAGFAFVVGVDETGRSASRELADTDLIVRGLAELLERRVDR